MARKKVNTCREEDPGKMRMGSGLEEHARKNLPFLMPSLIYTLIKAVTFI